MPHSHFRSTPSPLPRPSPLGPCGISGGHRVSDLGGLAAGPARARSVSRRTRPNATPYLPRPSFRAHMWPRSRLARAQVRAHDVTAPHAAPTAPFTSIAIVSIRDYDSELMENTLPLFFKPLQRICIGRMCVFTRSLPSVCYVLAPVGEHDLALALLRHQPDNTDDVEHGQLVRGRQDGARQCTLRPISGQSGDDKYANCRVVLCMAHRRRRDAPAACQRRQRALSRHGEHAST